MSRALRSDFKFTFIWRKRHLCWPVPKHEGLKDTAEPLLVYNTGVCNFSSALVLKSKAWMDLFLDYSTFSWDEIASIKESLFKKKC